MNEELLNRFYRRYQREIYLYLFSLCGNRHLAEDLLQETFLKALLSLSDDHRNIRAWLYLVARNLFFNHRKREARVISSEDHKENFGVQEQEILDRLIANETKKLLYRAMARLEPKKREVIEMQYFGGLSQKEIAAVLKITPENVRVLSYRARKELRVYMEAEDR